MAANVGTKGRLTAIVTLACCAALAGIATVSLERGSPGRAATTPPAMDPTIAKRDFGVAFSAERRGDLGIWRANR